MIEFLQHADGEALVLLGIVALGVAMMVSALINGELM